MKILLYLLSVVVVCCLLSSSALAQTPIGPPVATLDAGQFAAGFSFGYSKGDVVGTVAGVSVIVKDIEVDTYMANLVFGLHEDWEIQIDIGASSYEDMDFSSTGDCAWGFGVKNTFAKQGNVYWGLAVTAHWFEAGDNYEVGELPRSEKVDWSEVKIAIGPSFEEGPLRFYGGPFLQFIDGKGKYTLGPISYSGDFEEDEQFGGFVGANIELNENTTFGAEYQFTGSGQTIGATIRFRF